MSHKCELWVKQKYFGQFNLVYHIPPLQTNSYIVKSKALAYRSMRGFLVLVELQSYEKRIHNLFCCEGLQISLNLARSAY